MTGGSITRHLNRGALPTTPWLSPWIRTDSAAAIVMKTLRIALAIVLVLSRGRAFGLAVKAGWPHPGGHAHRRFRNLK